MSNPSGPINVMLCGDDNRAWQIAVTIRSVISNSADPNSLAFYVLAGMNESSKAKLANSLQDADLTIVDVVPERFANLPGANWRVPHISPAAWLRVFAPAALPDVERVIYMDADVLVLDDLADLWNTDLEGSGLGASWSAIMPSFEEAKLSGSYAGVSVKGDEKYFNSGVMVCDLDYWRKANVTERALSVAADRGSELLFPDQDSLNIAFMSGWVNIGIAWNNPWVSRLTRDKNATEAQVAEAMQQSRISHFTSPLKPWDEDFPAGLAKDAWDGFAAQVQWVERRPQARQAESTVHSL